MDRRDFLALSGVALVGLAGCGSDSKAKPDRDLPSDGNDGDGGDGSDGRPGQTRRQDGGLQIGHEASAAGQTATLWDVEVQTSEHYLSSSTLDVYSPADAHLVFPRVTTTGDPRPPRSAFALEVGDATYTPRSSVADIPLAQLRHPYLPYAADNESSGEGQWLLFEVPERVDAENASLVWSPSGGSPVRWPFRDEWRAALAAPAPAFTVDAFEVTVDGGKPTATLTVTNTSETSGVFRAATNYRKAMTATRSLEFAVPGGGTKTQTLDLLSAEGTLVVELAWSGPHEERTLELGN